MYGPSSQPQDLQQSNAVRKINSLLSSGAVSVTGPIQPRILKHHKNVTASQQQQNHDNSTTNNNQSSHITKCYICDEYPGPQPIVITQASTSITNTKLPNKIGHVVGDAFMVIVCVDDVICKKCMTLFNQIDRIENDLENIKNNLLKSIYKKYNIDDEATNTTTTTNTTSTQQNKNISSPPIKMQKLNNSGTANATNATNTTYSNRKLIQQQQNNDDEELLTRKITVTQKQHQIVSSRDSVENQLSSLFESSSSSPSTTDRQIQITAHGGAQQSQQKQRGPVKIYKCMTCEFKTTDLKQFQPHYEHCRKTPSTPPALIATQAPQSTVVQTGFRCKICKKLFASVAALKQHNIEKHNAANDVTQNQTKTLDVVNVTSTTGTGTGVSTTTNQLYSCIMCQYKTPDKTNYDDHLRKHIKMKPFKCRICSMRFETRDQASLHAKSHQPDYFKCGSCAISFPQRDLLLKHFEVHEKEKQQQQAQTQKLLQETIDEALRIDTIADPIETKDINFFTCDICAVTFLKESFYNQHMVTQHNKGKTTISGSGSGGNTITTTSSSINSNATSYTQIITTAASLQQQQQIIPVNQITTNILGTTVSNNNGQQQQRLLRQQQQQQSNSVQSQQQQQQQSNSISDADLESIFEKIHSDKSDIDVSTTNHHNIITTSSITPTTTTSNDNTVSGVVITSQENAGGNITYNITLPQGEELTLNQEQKLVSFEYFYSLFLYLSLLLRS